MTTSATSEQSSNSTLSNVIEGHTPDETSPNWKDFYIQYQQYLQLVEIRHDRRLCILNISDTKTNTSNDNANEYEHKSNADSNNNINNNSTSNVNISSAGYIFFVHGACARMGQFEHQIEYLSKQNFNIIAFDRIGCGLSDKPLPFESYSDIEIFADLCTLFEKYIPQSTMSGKPVPIYIIGHSFGCSQIQRLLAKYLNGAKYGFNVHGVILMASSGFSLGKKLDFLPNLIFSLPVWALAKMQNRLSAGFLDKAIHENSSPKLLAIENSFLNTNPPYMFGSFYAQITPCTELELQQFCEYNLPILLIHGKEDELAKVECSEKLSEIFINWYLKKQSKSEIIVQLHCLNECKHQVMQEKYEMVNEFIQTFINSTSKTNENAKKSIENL